MMKENGNELWSRFEVTGAVEDYLKYKSGVLDNNKSDSDYKDNVSDFICRKDNTTDRIM